MSEQVDDDSGDDAIDDYFFNDDDDFAYDQSNEDEPQFGSVDRDLVSERFKSPMSRFEESMAHAFAQDAADDLEDAKSEFIRRLTLPATGHDPEFEDDGEFEEQIQYHIMDRMTGSGLTMMAHAASSNDVPFMQSLLNAGARLTETEAGTGEPLRCAVMAGATEAVSWLLDRGVAINPTAGPQSLLVSAIEREHEDVALLLVEHGADLNHRVNATLNLLTFAVSRNMVRVARRIAELAPHQIAQQMEWNCELLILSCNNAAFLSLTQHILANFSPDLSECLYDTSFPALFTACDRGSLAHVELLLASGAPVDQHTSRGTALHAAAHRGHSEILECLLARGAAVEPAQQWSSYTPLMLAVRNGFVAVARRLVDAGANTTAQTQYGETLLHLATYSGNAETVRFVLPLCDVEQGDDNGVTAAEWACLETSAAFDDVLDVLLAAGAKLVIATSDVTLPPLTALGATGRFDAVKRGIERGVFSVHWEANGVNLMYFAARRGNVEMMRWLLARRIAFDLASTAGTVQVGETPLFVAAHAGQLGALRVLADAGANMRHATECGDTPLRAAAREGYGDCVRFLLQRGVKPTRIDLEQCVEHAQSADALIELLAHGCTADSALLALLVRTDTVNPHAELTTNARKFMVLWHAGVLLGEVAMTSHITALARICGAVPPVDCSLGESCRDLTNEHQQLFFHKWQSAGETHLTADVFAFVDTVARKGVALVGDRAVQVLFGLQSLGLPALVSTIIIDCACPLATLVSMHLKWRLVTLVKHFKDEDNKNKNDKKRTK